LESGTFQVPPLAPAKADRALAKAQQKAEGQIRAIRAEKEPRIEELRRQIEEAK
jgi:hypothetical protein